MKYSQETVDKIRGLHLEGKNAAEIASIYNIPYQSVWGIVANRSHFDSSYKSPRRIKVTEANIDYLLELRSLGMRYKHIAEVASIKIGHNVSTAAVWQAIQRHTKKESECHTKTCCK